MRIQSVHYNGNTVLSDVTNHCRIKGSVSFHNSLAAFAALQFVRVAVGDVRICCSPDFILKFVDKRYKMGIVLFLIDTSASMNQKTFLGTTYLDVAKGTIDTFIKVGCTIECPKLLATQRCCVGFIETLSFYNATIK